MNIQERKYKNLNTLMNTLNNKYTLDIHSLKAFKKELIKLIIASTKTVNSYDSNIYTVNHINIDKVNKHLSIELRTYFTEVQAKYIIKHLSSLSLDKQLTYILNNLKTVLCKTSIHSGKANNLKLIY